MPVGYYGKRSRRGRYYGRRRYRRRGLFTGKRRFYYPLKPSRGFSRKAPEDRVAPYLPPPSYLTTFRRMSSISAVFTTDVLGLTNSLQLTMSLADLPGVTEMSTLFDQYRILGIKAHIFYTDGNSDDVASVTARAFPVMYVSEDYDDKAAISLTTMEQRSDCRVVNVGDMARTGYDVNVPPFALTLMTGLDGGAAHRPTRSPWLDMANQNIDHGVSKFLVTGTSSTTYTFRVVYECTFQCRVAR